MARKIKPHPPHLPWRDYNDEELKEGDAVEIHPSSLFHQNPWSNIPGIISGYMGKGYITVNFPTESITLCHREIVLWKGKSSVPTPEQCAKNQREAALRTAVFEMLSSGDGIDYVKDMVDHEIKWHPIKRGARRET